MIPLRLQPAFLLALLPAALFAAPEPVAEVDNGTDPTRLNTTAVVTYEHVGLVAGATDSINASYVQPLGAARRTSLRLKVPFVRNDALGSDDFGLGDLGLKASHILHLTRSYGLLTSAEFVFDSAERAELGSGQNVFKPGFTYAKFLKDGSIFAPAIVQSNSLWGDDRRARVNSTVFDFYYVPHLANPRYFITVDPAMSLDWEGEREFASLSITLGRSLGPALGGSSQASIRPTVFAGGERPADWGIEIGYKVIGF
jgi:hypothetical protein